MWSAALTLICASTPTPLLVVSSDAARAESTARALTRDERLITLDDALRAPPPDVTAEVEAALAAVPRHLRGLDFTAVTRTLDGLDQTLSRSDWRVTHRAWLQTRVLRGFALHLEREADPTRGVEEVVGALALEPDLVVELPRAERFARWLDEQRRRARKLARGLHRITADVPTPVWVDGVFRGVTPIEVDLPRGLHQVVSATPGRERTQRVIDSTVTDAFVLEPGGALTRPGADAVRAAAREARPLPPDTLDEVLVLRLEPSASVQRLSANGVTAPAPLEALTADALLSARAPTPPTTNPAGPTPRPVRASSLTSFVVAGAFAVAAAICLGLGQAAFGRGTMVPQLDGSTYARTMNEGRLLTGSSAALLGAAVLAAGVGFVFMLD
jgi:hypothetical protein